MKKDIDKIMLKNALRLVFAGWVYDGGDAMEIPDILNELRNDYEEAIKKAIK